LRGIADRYLPRDAPALAATAPELEPEGAPTAPELALEDGPMEDGAEEGETPCQEEFPLKASPW